MMPSINIVFKGATIDDIDQIKCWYNKIDGQKYLSHYVPTCVLDNKNNQGRVFRWFIVFDQNNEIGTIWLEQKDLTSNELDLGIFLYKVELMGRGKGRSIIKEFIEDQKDLLRDYIICLNVRTNNERAIKCYRSLGFKVIDQKQKKSGEMIIDSYRMHL